jgi:hypothetical protein
MHLTKPVMLFFLPLLWIWQGLVLKISWRRIGVIVVVFLVVISPWVVRNYLVLDSIVISTTSSGQVLWEGNNPWNTTGGVSGSFEDPEAYLAEMPGGLTERQRDEWKKEQAKNFIINNPKRFLENSLKKFVRFWNLWPNTADYNSQFYKLISVSTFGVILVLSIVGYAIFRDLRQRMTLGVLVIIYITLIHMITIGSIRYRLPLEPLLIAVASLTVSRALDRLTTIVR